MKAGKPQKQAVAIALHEARESKGKGRETDKRSRDIQAHLNRMRDEDRL
jgi:hypothetical protein